MVKKYQLHLIVFLLSAAFYAGCTADSPDHRIRTTETEQEANEIFFGKNWPIGSTFALSDSQARQLREIVDGTKIVDPFSKLPEGMTVSPAPDFSYFTVFGETFHFVPPSTPHNFHLTAEKQAEFDHFISEEFGIAKRWLKPRVKE